MWFAFERTWPVNIELHKPMAGGALLRMQQAHRAAGSLNHLKRAPLKLGGAEKSTLHDLAVAGPATS
jgi:hypothetical protein